MWILILTIVVAGWAQGGSSASIEHVGEFSTVELCQAAGNAWLNNTKNMAEIGGVNSFHRSERSAVCVKRQ